MQERFKDMAQRLENAHAKLVEIIKHSSSLTDTETDAGFVVSHKPISTRNATIVADFYIKHKLAKLRVNDGGVTFKHGAFLERNVIKRALGRAKA